MTTEAAPRKRVAKKASGSAVKKKKAAPAANGLTIIRPDEDGYDTNIGRRGKPDEVTPVLDPVLDNELASGSTQFQLPTDKPFTINQVRRWAGLASERIGRKIRVSGGGTKNIQVEVLD